MSKIVLPKKPHVAGATAMKEERTANLREITEDLMPRRDVARLLGVCERTMRKWELAGEGPPVIRLRKQVFYRSSAVRRWLLQQESVAA